MPRLAATSHQRALALLLATLALAACTEHRDAARTSMGPAGRAGYTLLTADQQLLCPTNLGLVPRAVGTGAEADANGNGTVCDRTTALGGETRTVTTDDIVVAAGVVFPPPPREPRDTDAP